MNIFEGKDLPLILKKEIPILSIICTKGWQTTVRGPNLAYQPLFINTASLNTAMPVNLHVCGWYCLQ